MAKDGVSFSSSFNALRMGANAGKERGAIVWVASSGP